MSSAQHQQQVAMVRASLGLSPREKLACWKRPPSVTVVELPRGIRR